MHLVRNFGKKIILPFLTLTIFISFNTQINAMDSPQFSAPVIGSVLEPTPTPPTVTEPAIINEPEQKSSADNADTNISLQPQETKFEYIKGGKIYQDFAGVPDFQYFAKISDDFIISYPAQEKSFYYYGHSETVYTYRSKIIDYIIYNTSSLDSSLDKYRSTIKQLGFTQLQVLKSEQFSDYINNIKRELIIDPDFIVDSDGIFISEGEETFKLLLIGRSLTYDINNMLSDCVELRFYSLSKSGFDILDISSALGTLDDSLIVNNSDGQSIWYYTPDVFGDINEIPSQYVTYLFTPDVLSDVNELPKNEKQSSLSTPDVLSDINELPKNEKQSPLSTPDVLNDVADIPNKGSSQFFTPNVLDDIRDIR